MSVSISIPATESGLVRVFALSLDEAAAKDLEANTPGQDGRLAQLRALGADALNHGHIEVFALSDLGDMPLPDYLVEGAGVQADALYPDRAKLAALDGWVMIVYSSAFLGREQTIEPAAALTLIGTYPQSGTDWSPAIDLSTPSALPKDFETNGKKQPSDAAMSGRVAMVALLVAFAVVGLMIWVGS